MEKKDMDQIVDDAELLGHKRSLMTEEPGDFIARALSPSFAYYELECLTQTYLDEDATLMT